MKFLIASAYEIYSKRVAYHVDGMPMRGVWALLSFFCLNLTAAMVFQKNNNYAVIFETCIS